MTDPRSRAAQELDSLLRRFSEWAIPKLALGVGDPEYWQARVAEARAALAVLAAVPQAEPQEREPERVFMCPLCGRVSSVAEYCTRPICVHSWEGNAGCPEVWDGDNVDGEGRGIEQSPQESFRSPGPHTWAEMVPAALGSVQEPGPNVTEEGLTVAEFQELQRWFETAPPSEFADDLADKLDGMEKARAAFEAALEGEL